MVLCSSCDGVPLKFKKEKRPGLQFTSTDYLSSPFPVVMSQWSVPNSICPCCPVNAVMFSTPCFCLFFPGCSILLVLSQLYYTGCPACYPVIVIRGCPYTEKLKRERKSFSRDLKVSVEYWLVENLMFPHFRHNFCYFLHFPQVSQKKIKRKTEIFFSTLLYNEGSESNNNIMLTMYVYIIQSSK